MRLSLRTTDRDMPMHEVRRGTLVGDATGRLFVVWGRCGPVAHLMPVLDVGRIACRDHIVRVRATLHRGEIKVLAVDAEARRHLPIAALMPMGDVSVEGLANLLRDVKAQKHDATIRENRREMHDTVGRAARASRARARRDAQWVLTARLIVNTVWPEQMAA